MASVPTSPPTEPPRRQGAPPSRNRTWVVLEDAIPEDPGELSPDQSPGLLVEVSPENPAESHLEEVIHLRERVKKPEEAARRRGWWPWRRSG